MLVILDEIYSFNCEIQLETLLNDNKKKKENKPGPGPARNDRRKYITSRSSKGKMKTRPEVSKNFNNGAEMKESLSY